MRASWFVFVLGLFSLYSLPMYAHSNHHHHKPKPEVDVKKAKTMAKHHVERLIAKKKIEESWRKSNLISAEKKKFGKQKEWVVIFQNNTIKNSKKNKLYIFLKLSGDFIAANFTGK